MRGVQNGKKGDGERVQTRGRKRRGGEEVRRVICRVLARDSSALRPILLVAGGRSGVSTPEDVAEENSTMVTSLLEITRGTPSRSFFRMTISLKG